MCPNGVLLCITSTGAVFRFVKVLGTHISYVLLKAGLPAWIVPALPVAVVFIIDPQLYKGGDKL